MRGALKCSAESGKTHKTTGPMSVSDEFPFLGLIFRGKRACIYPGKSISSHGHIQRKLMLRALSWSRCEIYRTRNTCTISRIIGNVLESWHGWNMKWVFIDRDVANKSLRLVEFHFRNVTSSRSLRKSHFKSETMIQSALFEQQIDSRHSFMINYQNYSHPLGKTYLSVTYAMFYSAHMF